MGSVGFHVEDFNDINIPFTSVMRLHQVQNYVGQMEREIIPLGEFPLDGQEAVKGRF